MDPTISDPPEDEHQSGLEEETPQGYHNQEEGLVGPDASAVSSPIDPGLLANVFLTELLALHYVKEEHFSGPIPPPSVLAGYESVVQGGADRLIAMAEREQIHRHQIDDKAQDLESTLSRRGLTYAFVLAAIVILVAGIVMLYANAVAGASLGIFDIGTITTIFILRRPKSDNKGPEVPKE